MSNVTIHNGAASVEHFPGRVEIHHDAKDFVTTLKMHEPPREHRIIADDGTMPLVTQFLSPKRKVVPTTAKPPAGKRARKSTVIAAAPPTVAKRTRNKTKG